MMQKGSLDAVEDSRKEGLGLHERQLSPLALADLLLKLCVAVLERGAHGVEVRGGLAELGLVLVVDSVPQVPRCDHPRRVDQRIDGTGDGPGQVHGDDDADDDGQDHGRCKEHPRPLDLLHGILRHCLKLAARLHGHALGLDEDLISDGCGVELHFVYLLDIRRRGDVIA